MIVKPAMESRPKGNSVVSVTQITLPPKLIPPLATCMFAIDSNHSPHTPICSGTYFSNPLLKIM